MEILKGDRVLVNVAPFIGSVMRSNETVPCVVLEVDGLQTLVRAEPPYRDVALWVLTDWIEGPIGQKRELISALGVGE